MERKEIGGYLELEENRGVEYYQDLISLNLGRTALCYLLQKRNYNKVYLPYFLCDSVIHACKATGILIEYYHIDEHLLPRLDKIETNACVYLVNYYGQLRTDVIRDLKRKYTRIILDNVHAFYQRPMEGIDTIYSCRKFFGLSDGAYLSADIEEDDSLAADFSASRMFHILGRFEKDGNAYYKTMLSNAEGYNRESVKAMSKLTHNLLRGIDYEYVKKRRNNNYAVLGALLEEFSGINFGEPEGPLCYPFYTENGMVIKTKLAEQKIYVPTYWGNVLENKDADQLERNLAANVLPLPCDQRYGISEMEIVAKAVLECIGEKYE